ncbi:RrF2 family transcriptional regulator [Streptomyces sp. NPDC051366]|uniref:RrF2 family transcriptional regulator n=1 Tax=Streptomyces sp. NPDC051366 TaxID=3365652 RepID=UPI0037A59AE6
MSEGVEWALHSCVNLAWAGPGRAVPAARLAAWHDLPAAYLNKQLQALARAGIVTSTPGPRGGFRLARPLAEITLMDVVAAVEGTEEAFRCTEIRQQGPGGAPVADDGPACAIAHAMNRAELAWRQALAAEDLDGIRRRAELQAPHAASRLRAWLAAGAADRPPGGGRPTARPTDLDN